MDGEGYFEPGRDAFAHDAVGVNYFDMAVPSACPNVTLVLYGAGDTLRISTDKDPVRFLLVSGRPIVMNTRDELRLAFQELAKGTFIKHAGE